MQNVKISFISVIIESKFLTFIEARVAQRKSLWSQGREFEPRVGLHVVSLSKVLYSNLLVSTQVYKWVPA